jgi:hypothetical protein
MQRRQLVRSAAAAVLTFALASGPAAAQTMKPGEVSASTSVTAVAELNTDLDRGGSFRWGAGIFAGTLTRQFTPELAAGVTVRYSYEAWKFDNPAAFGGKVPWDNLNAPNIAVNFSYAVAPDVSIGVSPTLGWSYESGASTGDALVYGAIVTATKVFSPALVLGVGASVVRQIDETKAFPFVIVRWQIDDHWLLANPFPAGPAGGAGLELSYAWDENWEIAGGGAYRSYRFRLSDTAATPNGIGENRFVPVFARVTRKLGPRSRLDLYAGISAGGRLSTENSNGGAQVHEDYKTAPVLGFTLSHRY